MAQPLVVPLTPGLIVSGDYIVRLTAVDALTGNTVTGVKVSASAILALDVSDTGGDNVDLTPPVLAAGLLPGGSDESAA